MEERGKEGRREGGRDSGTKVPSGHTGFSSSSTSLLCDLGRVT